MAKENKSRWAVLRSLFNREEAEKRSSTVPQSSMLLTALTDYGVPVNNDTALKNTALFAGIRIIAENIASLPKNILRFDQDGRMTTVRNHPVFRLINVRPNGYTNAYVFWSTIVTWIKGWGNAYAFIERDQAGHPVALHQVHPANVKVTLVGDKKWYQLRMNDTELSRFNGEHSDDDVLHFMALTLDGITGLNPIIYNAAVIGKSLATEGFAADFYKKGGNIRAVIETENSLGDDDFMNFSRHFKASSQNFETPILEYGMKYKQLSIDPVAAQLVQSEILSIQDICRLINIPPHMVAELSHATFSNIEHQTIQFVEYSLRPVIKNLEVELEDKLFNGDEYDVKFILDGLLRGDTTARSAYYHNAILDGYMSRNEVREMEGMEPADGLDDYLYPLNTGVVGEKIDNNSSE